LSPPSATRHSEATHQQNNGIISVQTSANYAISYKRGIVNDASVLICSTKLMMMKLMSHEVRKKVDSRCLQLHVCPIVSTMTGQANGQFLV